MMPRVLPLGDAAFTVEFGDTIAPGIERQVRGFAAGLTALAGRHPGIVEWVPTFRSVTVHFDPDRVDPARLADDLLALAGEGRSVTASGPLRTLPVCFDADCAPDLADVAAAAGLSRDNVVGLLSSTEFTVCMLGFLPGFPYLGGLPAILTMPRLVTPRLRVPAGSVAIAGGMAAVYPWDSPGGWRLVGRTGSRLFDAADPQRPALLAPGDRVRWQAVGRDAIGS